MADSMEIMGAVASIIREKAPTTVGLEIAMDTLLKEALGLDSLRLVQIMVAIEDQFGIEFEVEDLDPRAFERISDLVVLTEKTIGTVDA